MCEGHLPIELDLDKQIAILREFFWITRTRFVFTPIYRTATPYHEVFPQGIRVLSVRKGTLRQLHNLYLALEAYSAMILEDFKDLP